MKRIIGLVAVLAAVALGMNAVASTNQLFGAGNIIIYRVGSGSQLLTNGGNSVFLDEYTTNSIWAQVGTFVPPVPVRSIQMPTNWFGAHAPLIGDGASLAEGALSLSTDGRYLVLAGYGATLGQFTNSSVGGSDTTNASGQADAPRVVGLVDGYGNIYTSTTVTNGDEDSDSIRSAVSTDGTNIWLAGASNGGKFITRGSMISTQVEVTANGGASNTRVLNIVSNVLYFTANGRVGSTTNLPITYVTKSFTNLAGTYGTGQGSPFGFCFFNLNGGSAPDTLYVADDVTNAPGEPLGKAGGVLKYCYIAASNAWVHEGYIYAQGATQVTGVKRGSVVDLYITEGGTVTPDEKNVMYAYTDTSGFAASPGPGGGADANGNHLPLDPPSVNADLINTRGIAWAPQGGDSGTITGPGVISVGPPYGPMFSGPAGGPFTPSSFTYSVANLGTNSTNYTASTGLIGWLTMTPTAGTLASGASTTVTISPNATANNEAGGTTYTGKLSFKTGGSGGTQVATPLVSLAVWAFTLTPSTNFISTGPQGGAFSPSNYVYQLSNATAGPLNWTASTSLNWNSLTNGLNYIADSLPGKATTNITVTINANANSLPIGTYSDTLIFTNASSGTQIDYRYVDLQVGVGFFDDFSTFTQDADLAGQLAWTGDPTEANPPQVTGGQVVIPWGCPGTTSQEPYKNIAANDITNATEFVYAGMLCTVTGAPTGAPDYSFAIYNHTYANGFADDRVGMTEVTPGSTYKWDCHISGIDGWQYGGQTFNYNQQYMVIIVGDVANSNTWVFVNPSDGVTADLFAMTPAVHDGPNVSGAGADPTAGSFLIGNYCGGVNQSGVSISKLAVSTNYTDVYNFLNPPPACPTPTASFTPASASGAPPLTVQFIDNSTTPSGTIAAWNWTFGDGGTSALQSPSHPYTSPGPYTASLIVTNSCGVGSTNAATATIGVYPDTYTWWRQVYFNSTNSAAGAGGVDADGTGMSNSNKFAASFNPTNPAAYLHIISIAKANPTDIRVIYLGANGDSTYVPGIAFRTNVLEFTAGLSNGSYATNNFASTGQSLILSNGTGLGSVVTNIDAGGATNIPSRYYRVRVLAP